MIASFSFFSLSCTKSVCMRSVENQHTSLAIIQEALAKSCKYSQLLYIPCLSGFKHTSDCLLHSGSRICHTISLDLVAQ